MGAVTQEILIERRGLNIGFFYLRERGEAGSGRKVQVFVKGEAVPVWDGGKWREYAEFEPSDFVEECVVEARAATRLV